MITFKVEDNLNEALGEMTKATRRNVVRRALLQAAEPVADTAARLAPEQSGHLAFSVSVSTQLTRRQKREGKQSEVEVYIGPAGGTGALNYASFVEFGTIATPAHPFMRPAWDGGKGAVLNTIKTNLGAEIERAAARAARKAMRTA